MGGLHNQTFTGTLIVIFSTSRPGQSQAQLYDCSRQCSRPVLAQCSMGFGPNPLINGLIQHTLKLNILFLEKFTVIHFDQTKLFFSSQVTMMFQKKIFFENKKIRVRFSIVDFPAKPAKQKKQVALKKIIELRPQPRNRCINFLKKIFFFQNF